MADRWHLAHNLTEQLDKVISARWKHLTKAVCLTEMPPELVPISPRHRRHRQAPGEARYRQALALVEAGLTAAAIAQQLGVGERTIQRWLTQQHGPYAGPRKQRRGPVDWTTAYLHERWDAGERNGVVLWEELKAQGYTGSLRSLYRRLGHWRNGHRRRGSAPAPGAVPRSPLDDLTPAQVIGWIIARPETLSPEAAACLEGLCQADLVIAQARNLAQRWLGFIRAHTSDGLDAWLNEMRGSGLPAIVAFARSIEQDKAAIMAGLSLPYSTGPVEGHITRLKLIKRQAYGQASLSYLQHRFLPAA